MIPFGGSHPDSFPKGVFFVLYQRSCPSCGSLEAVRFGKRKGVQRWRCKGCGAVFTAATGTPFSSAKLGRAKLETVLSMIVRDCTVGDVADIVKVSTRTAYVLFVGDADVGRRHVLEMEGPDRQRLRQEILRVEPHQRARREHELEDQEAP